MRAYFFLVIFTQLFGNSSKYKLQLLSLMKRS